MCDGTGWMNERYIDVDLTTADRCPGCPECDEDLAQRLEAARIEDEFGEYREAVPLWAGMNVYDAPPIAAHGEYRQQASKGAINEWQR